MRIFLGDKNLMGTRHITSGFRFKNQLREITQIFNKLLPGYTNFETYDANSDSGLCFKQNKA